MSATRGQRLYAIVQDPNAAPAERAMAARLLVIMQQAGELGVIVHVQESWELALLDAVCTDHGLLCTPVDGGVHVDGANLDTALAAFTRLYTALETVVVTATAGFLSATFPAQQQGAARPPDAIVRAAQEAADAARPPVPLLRG